MNASAHSEQTAGRRPTLVDEAERALRDWLAPGHRRQGDRLPPEHDLAAQLGISRGTLRTALQRLEQTGEVVRRQGSGTFVGDIGELRAFSEGLERLTPYSRLARARGIELRCRDLSLRETPLSDELAVLFEVDLGAPALTCERVLLADGKPTALMHDVVHPAIDLPPEPQLRQELTRGRMLLDVLLDNDVSITYSRTRVRARAIGPEDERGHALGVESPTSVLELEETMHDRRGAAVQRSSDLFAPGGIDLHVIRHLEIEQPAPISRIPG
jgi:GntR family transcriptional regulator